MSEPRRLSDSPETMGRPEAPFQRASLTKAELHEYGAIVFEASRQTGQPLTIIFADLDDLKGVNDEFGHARGDEVLENVDTIISRTISDKPAARSGLLGGDEFGAVLPNTDAAAASAFVMELDSEFHHYLSLPANKSLAESERVSVGLSIGASTYDPKAEPNLTFSELLTRADRAMYDAKLAHFPEFDEEQLQVITKFFQQIDDRNIRPRDVIRMWRAGMFNKKQS